MAGQEDLLTEYPRLIIDGHCDTILKIHKGISSLGQRNSVNHVDIPRLVKAGVGVQFFALFIETEYKPERALKRCLQLIATFYDQLATYPNVLVHVKQPSDLTHLKASQIGALLSIEGGEPLSGEISLLKVFYHLGVRAITLTWNQRNDIADGASESTGGGLTSFGKRVVEEMNRLGMIIDVSHMSEPGFWDVLETSTEPILASHSCCKSLCDHPRNLSDEQLRAISKNGGMACITFCPQFLVPEEKKAGLDHVIRHIDNAVQVAGIDHIGIGSDFDGTDDLPSGISGCHDLPRIAEGLTRLGYSDDAIYKIMGRNLLGFVSRIISSSKSSR